MVVQLVIVNLAFNILLAYCNIVDNVTKIDKYVTLQTTTSYQSTQNKPKLYACCAKGFIIDRIHVNDSELLNCVDSNKLGITNKNPYFLDVKVYNYDKYLYDTGKKVHDVFEIIHGNALDDTFRFAQNEGTYFNYYLSQDGKLHLEIPNRWNRWDSVNSTTFCLDYELKSDDDSNTSQMLSYWMTPKEMPPPMDNMKSTYQIILSVGMLISCLFLALVLIVYAMLPELRNHSGKVQMLYVIGLLVAYALLVHLKLLALKQLLSAGMCKGMTAGVYFFFLSSFSWMNVMSYDIWWTFRGYAKSYKIDRRGENVKLMLSCLYSYGVPTALTVFMMVVNEMNLRHIPWFIKPNLNADRCFFPAEEKFLYMNIPMLIMLVANWVFYMMTAFNIWRVQRSLAVLDSTAAGNRTSHRQQKYRFITYLKLSIVMGVGWLLEGVSTYNVTFSGWYVADAYITLYGAFIFLVLICKKRIYKMLKIRYGKATKGKHVPCKSGLLRTQPNAEDTESRSTRYSDMSRSTYSDHTEESDLTVIQSFNLKSHSQ